MIDRRNRALLILSSLLVLAFILLPPYSILEKMRLVGYAVCHQLPSRSFFMDSQQLPMCARNTGIFVGTLFGFLVLVATGKVRKVMLPPVAVSIVLVVFIVFMGIDGVNSYLPSLFGLPNIYEPQNSLRLITGILAGISISIFLFPAVNYVAWRETKEEPVLMNFRELAVFLVGAAIIVVAILPEPDFLLIPVSLASGLGTITLMTSVSLIPVLIIMGWDGKADNWRDMVLPVLLAILISFLMIGFVGLLRNAVIGSLSIDLK